MIKLASLNRYTWVGLALVLLYLFFVAYIRFTHQDIGWYYAYADRLASRFSLNNSQSTWSFADANGDNGAGGIIFILLQFVAIVISSNDLMAVKVLAALIAISVYLAFYFLLKNRLGIKHYFAFSLLLLVDPMFSFQVMNRPEMLACAIALFIYNIGLSERQSPWKFFWLSFLTMLLLDVHPISVYMVAGFNVILFFRNYRKFLFFAGGAILGIALVTALNYLFNKNVGIFAFFGDSKQYMNDHYFPLFTDPFLVILTRPFYKLKYYIIYFLFGALFIYLAWYFKKLKEIILAKKEYSIIFLNAVIFFFLSNLFSEGGNGYHLYSLTVYLTVFVILYSEILNLIAGRNARLIFILALGIVPAFGLYKSLPRFNQWVRYNSYFKENYYKINDYVEDSSRILLRPDYSFALHRRKVYCEPTFPIMMHMYKYHRNFPQAILAKNFDIVAIDEMFLHDVDIKTPIDKYSYGDFYKSVQQVRFNTQIIEDLVQHHVFNPIYQFNDFYHGKTIFYRVDKQLLKEYCEANR